MPQGDAESTSTSEQTDTHHRHSRNLANIMAGHENLLADALNLDSWQDEPLLQNCRSKIP